MAEIRKGVCPRCKGVKSYFATLCRSCRTELHDKEYGERDALIVEFGDKGTKTLSELGEEFGISRERVRQIYFRQTGKPFTSRILNVRRIGAAVREGARRRLETSKPVKCAGCRKPYQRYDFRQRYCTDCQTIRRNQRDPRITLRCFNCKKDFHPLLNAVYSLQNRAKFCTIACYTSSSYYRQMTKDRVAKLTAKRLSA